MTHSTAASVALPAPLTNDHPAVTRRYLDFLRARQEEVLRKTSYDYAGVIAGLK